jgi:hypothetical protein
MLSSWRDDEDEKVYETPNSRVHPQVFDGPEQRGDSDPNGSGGVGLVCPGSLGALRNRRSRGRAGIWCPAPSPADL